MMNVTNYILGSVIVLLIALFIYNNWKKSVPDRPPEEGIGVKKLITQVTSELIEAERSHKDSNQAPLFKLKEFQLEINFVIKTVETASGKLQYEVVTVEGKDEISSEKVQKITLKMDSITAEPQEKPVSLVEPLKTDKPTTLNTPPPKEKKK